MTTKRTKPRLGRGLSSLLGDPVSVEAPATADHAPPKQVDQSSSSADHAARNGHPPKSGIDSGLVLLALGEIVVNRHQPRSEMADGALEALAASIRASGVMQPIAVRPIRGDDERGGEGAKYELIAGERRWRAAGMAGLARIPVIVRELDDRACAEWALVENIQREDLNPIDRGMALLGLVERFGLSHAAVGERVGMDRSSVTNFIRLTELEASIRELIRRGALSVGHGKALLGLPVGSDRERVAARAAAESWTVRRLESLRAGGGGVRGRSGAAGRVRRGVMARTLSFRIFQIRLEIIWGRRCVWRRIVIGARGGS